jgi:hypothetical protein
MQSEIGEIPFIGERGFYPRWARGSARWVFQRTTIIIGQMGADMARIHAMEVPVADQYVVWVPPTRLPILGALPSAVHQERQQALNELSCLKLVCYGEECGAPKPGSCSYGMSPDSVVKESGVQPDKWLLRCPKCGASVGPDISSISAGPLIRRWESVGRPRLEDPGAGWNLQPRAAVVDLPQWIERSKPSHFELAYFGPQMWPNIETMFASMAEA